MSQQTSLTLPLWPVDYIGPSPEMLALRANGPTARGNAAGGIHPGFGDSRFPGVAGLARGGRACSVTHDRGAGLQRPQGEAAHAVGRGDPLQRPMGSRCSIGGANKQDNRGQDIAVPRTSRSSFLIWAQRPHTGSHRDWNQEHSPLPPLNMLSGHGQRRPPYPCLSASNGT